MLVVTGESASELRLTQARQGCAMVFMLLVFLPLFATAAWEFRHVYAAPDFRALVLAQLRLSAVLFIPLVGLGSAFAGDPNRGWNGRLLRFAISMVSERSLRLRRTEDGVRVAGVSLIGPLQIELSKVVETYSTHEGQRSSVAYPIAIAEAREGGAAVVLGRFLVHAWARSMARRLARKLVCDIDDQATGSRIAADALDRRLLDSSAPAPGPMPESIAPYLSCRASGEGTRLTLRASWTVVAAMFFGTGLVAFMWLVMAAFQHSAEEGQLALCLFSSSAAFMVFLLLFGLVSMVLMPQTLVVGPRKTVVGPRGLGWFSEHVAGSAMPTAEIVEVAVDGEMLVLYSEARGLPMTLPFETDDAGRAWLVRAIEHTIAGA